MLLDSGANAALANEFGSLPIKLALSALDSEVADPEALVIRMYNITPDGQEMIAVELPCPRTERN